MSLQEKKILIVGLGLIGGSYAIGLKENGCEVYGISLEQETIDYALRHRIIDEGSTYPDGELISKADIVIFALYPTAMVEWIEQNQQHFKSGALLTDVSGVKCGIIDKVQSFLRDDVEFIGSHPMAGKEVSGIKNADERIFFGANYIITPTDKNTYHAVQQSREIAETLGFGKISVLTPEEHDEMIGFVSQLTHAVAVSLMNTSDNTSLKDYTGDSFRDLTRIANINEVMWTELFILNKEKLIREIDDFVSSLEHLRDAIKEEDKDELYRLFIRSTERRKHFDK